MWFDTQALNTLLQGYKENADLVVCSMDIDISPSEEATPLIAAGEGPGLVLLNGWVENIGELIKTTCLDSVVLYQQNAATWKPGDKVPVDPQEAFSQRYLLVTKDNVEALAGKHPQI